MSILMELVTILVLLIYIQNMSLQCHNVSKFILHVGIRLLKEYTEESKIYNTAIEAFSNYSHPVTFCLTIACI